MEKKSTNSVHKFKGYMNYISVCVQHSQMVLGGLYSFMYITLIKFYKSVHIYTQYSLTADESLAEDKPPLYSTDQ